MSIKLGIVMDPIGAIKVEKDSSFAMLLAAQARGWQLRYMELPDLFLRDGRAYARMRLLEVRDDNLHWFELGEAHTAPLDALDILLMRKDPPVDPDYFAATYLLERAEAAGVLVVNRPSSLRDVNEKLFTAWFPDCCPPTLVSARATPILDFLDEQGDIILKPLWSMGGASVFRVRAGDPNTNVIIETLTGGGRSACMAQRYVPEISAGDKRILLIDGEPVPYALARIPAKGETRGNLAAGGRGEGVELTARDRWICERLGPTLRDKGLYFVGIDVIGDWLTEINVTSPTCIRELDRIYGLDIAGQLMDRLAEKLPARS
ncbi:MAG TPA: glutathione synthase [Thiotrichales bacterium]|nr:glutathione synthase [Thiotrichales bacterium]